MRNNERKIKYYERCTHTIIPVYLHRHVSRSRPFSCGCMANPREATKNHDKN